MRPHDPSGSLILVVRRLIPASPDAVFAAWTEPAHLLKWWGPRGVSLAAAEIDLRVGGRYRLASKTARSVRVRRQGLEPRTRGLRAGGLPAGLCRGSPGMLWAMFSACWRGAALCGVWDWPVRCPACWGSGRG